MVIVDEQYFKAWSGCRFVELVQFFGENITAMASGFDALWIVLAVYMAWSIPKASGLKI